MNRGRNPDDSSSKNAFFHPQYHFDYSIRSQLNTKQKATSHYPIDVDPFELRALVFSGGGIAGNLHCATLQLLVDEGVLHARGPLLEDTAIDTVVASSAGALLGLLIVAGCSMNEIYSTVRQQFPVNQYLRFSPLRFVEAIEKRDITLFSFTDFENVHRLLYARIMRNMPEWKETVCRSSGERSSSNTAHDSHVEKQKDISSPVQPHPMHQPTTPIQLLPELECWCAHVSCHHDEDAPLGLGCLTFRLLYDLTSTDLRVVVTDAHSYEPVECSVDSTPDVCVFRAVMASMAYPLIFPPVYLASRTWGCTYREFRDGGIASNYPIEFAVRTYAPHQIVGSFISSLTRETDENDSQKSSEPTVYGEPQRPLGGHSLPHLSVPTARWGPHRHSDTSQSSETSATISQHFRDSALCSPHTAFPISRRDALTTLTPNRREDELSNHSETALQFLQYIARVMLSLGGVAMRFASWKLVPDAWKARTVFPPVPPHTRIHVLSFHVPWQHIIEAIKESTRELHKDNAVCIHPCVFPSVGDTPSNDDVDEGWVEETK